VYPSMFGVFGDDGGPGFHETRDVAHRAPPLAHRAGADPAKRSFVQLKSAVSFVGSCMREDEPRRTLCDTVAEAFQPLVFFVHREHFFDGLRFFSVHVPGFFVRVVRG